MSGATLNIDWSPTGPIAARFMASDAMVQIINGPIGSGKTTAACMKAIRIATRQRPSLRTRARNSRGEMTPVRLFKLCTVRDTYRQLWKTTLPSWWERVPREVGDFTGAENAPATHRITFELADGTLVDFHNDFIAIGENAVEDVMRGYQPTAWYLNEADLLVREVLTYARGRAGRYPSAAEGGPTWFGVLADCNAPELNSWLYEDVFTKAAADLEAIGVALFRQPSGLSPLAENTANLPKDYYKNAAAGAPAWYVARMIENKSGFSRDGKPVYPEFNDGLHVSAAPLEAVRGLKLILGADAGLSPAAVIRQRMPNGQWRLLDELVTEQGVGPLRFSERLNRLLAERYPAWPKDEIEAWADPSAAYGADKEAGERSWIEIVAHATGIRFRAAPTNNLILRLEAVRRPMTRLLDDGQPAFLMSERCAVLRAAYNALYRYRKIPVPGRDRFDEKPEKNDASHPADADQYAALGGGEHLDVLGRRRAPALGRQIQAIDEDSPAGGYAEGGGGRRDRSGAPLRQSEALE